MASRYTTAQKILERIDSWETKQRTHVNSMSNEDAYEALKKSGLTDEQIKKKSENLLQNGKPSEYRFQASYGDLHGIFHLDDANKEFDLSNNPKAAIKRAILQAMEVAILNIQDLSPRVAEDVKNNELNKALEKFGWVSDFSETLRALCSLERQIPSPGRGIKLTVKDHSAVAEGTLKDLEEVLYKSISDAGLITEEQLNLGLSSPPTKFLQQGSLNQSYTDIWSNKTVNIPDIIPTKNEDEKSFYKRFVGTEHINLAVNEITQKGDNFLKQFKAFHQISEVLVKLANNLLCKSIKTLLSDSKNEVAVEDAMQNTDISLLLLKIIPENVKPILNNLGVKQYQDIRDSLGITSGSYSNNIREGLFTPLHELFFQTVYCKVMGTNEKGYDPEQLQLKLNDVFTNPSANPKTSQNYRLAMQALKLDAVVTDWRDLHLQLVKTQIGANSSISGGLVGIKSAVSFILASEKIQFTPPIYIASGVEPRIAKSAKQIVTEILNPKTFVGKVGSTTGAFVGKLSKDVNDRVKDFNDRIRNISDKAKDGVDEGFVAKLSKDINDKAKNGTDEIQGKCPYGHG
jgi:tryptophan 2,3-dioxygenase